MKAKDGSDMSLKKRYPLEIEESFGDGGSYFSRGHHDAREFLAALYDHDDLATTIMPSGAERHIVGYDVIEGRPDLTLSIVIVEGEHCSLETPDRIVKGWWRPIYDFDERQSLYHWQHGAGRGVFPVTVLEK